MTWIQHHTQQKPGIIKAQRETAIRNPQTHEQTNVKKQGNSTQLQAAVHSNKHSK